MEALVQKNENLQQARDRLEHLSQDPVARAAADARDKFLWDQNARERAEREEGRKEGIEIGEKRGIQIGEKRGFIEAAKKFIASGMDPKAVCEMIGISESDLF